MRTKSNQNKLMKIITTPIRVLKKGRDMYVESMMNYAHKPRYTSGTSNKGSAKMGQQGVSGLPKSFSTSVTSTRSNIYDEGDDFRELIRANSATHKSSSTMNLDVENYVKQLIEEQKLSRQKLYNNDHNSVENGMNSRMAKGVPRSYSVGLGRIDEGKACEFDEEEEEEEEVEDGVKKVPEAMLRSRSHAVGVGNRKSSLAF